MEKLIKTILKLHAQAFKLLDLKSSVKVKADIKKRYSSMSEEKLLIEISRREELIEIYTWGQDHKIQCEGKTQEGRRCSKTASAGDNVCGLHKDQFVKGNRCLAQTSHGAVCGWPLENGWICGYHKERGVTEYHPIVIAFGVEG